MRWWWLTWLLGWLKPQSALIAENLCLRQQLAVFARKQGRPLLRDADRRFWVLMVRWFGRWRECLVIAKPETVLAWHSRG
jgi:hypothetical protein